MYNYDEVATDGALYSTLPKLLDSDEPDGLGSRVPGIEGGILNNPNFC